jgi:5-methylthioadenosine/S-adenosylhomocysteine deaminase
MDPSRPVIEDAAVLVEGERISAVDQFDALRHLSDGAEIIGSTEQWLMPGFVNAHHHGAAAGGSFRKGGADGPLERQLLAGHSSITYKGFGRFAYLNTLWLAGELIRSGVTCTTDFYYGAEEPPYLTCENGLQAYQQSGMRVAFIPVARECGSYVHGDDEVFLAGLPTELASRARELGLGRQPNVSQEVFVDCWKRIHDDFNGYEGRIQVFLGPDGPQWVSADYLRAIKNLAGAYGTGIQIHLLETRYEMLYGPRVLGQSVSEFLEGIGFLGPEVSGAHSVWLTDRDIEIYARTGTSAVHNPVSNLRLSSGISPVAPMLASGINVAVGTDSFGMNDDNDYICDLRLAAYLQRTPGIASTGLPSAQVLEMGTVNGAKALLLEGEVGSIRPGMKADLILLDTERMTSPVVHPGIPPEDIVVHRGMGQDVNTVIINGQVVMADREILTFDESKVKEELRIEAARAWESTKQAEQERQDTVREVEPYVVDYFESWDSSSLPARYQYNTR